MLEQEPASPVIREASVTDAEALSALVGQLGYPATAHELPGRLEALIGQANVVALVAELEHGVVGLVTLHLIRSIHASQPVAWLTSLVVDEAARGRGVGGALVRRAEEWARERGATRIAVTSALRRTAAHEFYERLGYARTGVRLGRSLEES